MASPRPVDARKDHIRVQRAGEAIAFNYARIYSFYLEVFGCRDRP